MSIAKPQHSKHTPIIILSASEWRDNPVSTMHIASILSEDRPVLFVETPGRRWPKFREYKRVIRRIANLFRGLHTPKKTQGLNPKQVTIFSPLAIPGVKHPWLRKINELILSIQIKHAIRRFSSCPPILWLFSPYWFNLSKKIKHKKLIFHCVDALYTYDNSQYFQSLFSQLVTQANIVFTPGLLLEKELKKSNANTKRIGHGCSPEHLNYQQQATTPFLPPKTKPRAVYSGCLANWVDYELLIKTATLLPTFEFILIGYIHGLTEQSTLRTLLSLENVHSTGYINFSELPSYYHTCDIGIIPYQQHNQHIQYCTPTKILDYFAAGLPCVSTRYPAVEELNNLVYIADTAEEFASLITTAYEKPTPREQLKQYAQSNSWPQQVAKMMSYVNE